MTVRRLQSDGDIQTSGTQFLSGTEEIAQTIRTRLLLFLGEYFRNINDGTDWFGSVLGKGQPLETKEAVIRRRILQTNGVQKMLEFEVDFDQTSRRYSVSSTVLTAFGPASVTIEDVI